MNTDKWVFDPVEPRADYICNNPETRDERIFALVVGLFELRYLYDRIGRLGVFLCMYASRGFVEDRRGISTGARALNKNHRARQ